MDGGGGTQSQGWTGGGVPHPRSGQGRYPIPGPDRGVLDPRSRRGYPINGLDKGSTPSQVQTGWVPHPKSGWGYPIPGPDRGSTPSQVWMGGTPFKIRMGVSPLSKTRWGTSHLRLDVILPLSKTGWGTSPPPSAEWGTPHPYLGWGVAPHQRLDGVPPPNISTASTCYAVGGVPLAFTQEDFLVFVPFTFSNDTT